MLYHFISTLKIGIGVKCLVQYRLPLVRGERREDLSTGFVQAKPSAANILVFLRYVNDLMSIDKKTYIGSNLLFFYHWEYCTIFRHKCHEYGASLAFSPTF
jgi:hypothetical protein